MVLEQCVQYFVKSHLAVFINQTILENSGGFIDKRLYQSLGLLNVIPEEIEDESSDVSRSK